MTYTINPFYAARIRRAAAPALEPARPIFARLPLAPLNASPVPHLTSLYHFHRAGDYGDCWRLDGLNAREENLQRFSEGH